MGGSKQLQDQVTGMPSTQTCLLN